MKIDKKREPNGSACEEEKTCLWALDPGQEYVNVTEFALIRIFQSRQLYGKDGTCQG
jgi:hypothetical protein